MTILVDSDVLIEVTRGKNVDIVGAWKKLSDSQDLIVCSPVTIAELWHGARASEYQVLRELFDSITCVPIDADIGQRAGEYLNRYRKSHGLELADALIAATAAMNVAHVWTRNRKHYPMKELQFY